MSAADVQAFEDVIGYYDRVRGYAQELVARVVHDTLPELDIRVTGRTKTTLTLRDKLQRTPAVKLPYVRDIAGVRVVAGMRLGQQDALADALAGASGALGAPRVDRRQSPVQGYRALHVVLSIDGTPVEVQVRTELQALWADLYGKASGHLGSPDSVRRRS
jgi:ppGpp synthetase/RelA/SpoT-type nucleotidyltranferase